NYRREMRYTMNKEDIYDQEISPLIIKIVKICKENNISFFSTFGLDLQDAEHEDFTETEQEDGLPPTLWRTTALTLRERRIDNDKIVKLYKIQYYNYNATSPFTTFSITTKSEEIKEAQEALEAYEDLCIKAGKLILE